ncbi:MAG: hypothetical protein ACREIA_12465, partial [Opitutaceae bacterium]
MNDISDTGAAGRQPAPHSAARARFSHGWQLRLEKILLGLFIAGGMLVVVESLARIAATVANDWHRSAPLHMRGVFKASPELGWVLRPGFNGVAEETHPRVVDQNGFRSVDTEQIADNTKPRV